MSLIPLESSVLLHDRNHSLILSRRFTHVITCALQKHWVGHAHPSLSLEKPV